MTKILAIARKDLRSTLRNRPALVMMLVAPLGLAALSASPSAARRVRIAATKVVVANLDKGGADTGQNAGAPSSSSLLATTSDIPATIIVDVRQRRPATVDDGNAEVAVVIPADFSPSSRQRPRRPEPGRAYENPTAAHRRLHRRGRRRPGAGRFNGARAAAAGAVARRPTRPAIPRRPGRASPPRRSPTPAASRPGHRSLSARRRPAPGVDVSVTGTILTGMMIFFMFFGAANVAPTILTEDRDGTMPRLFTTPTRHGDDHRRQVRGGLPHRAGQAIGLLIAGRLIFSIHWGRLDAVILLTVVAAGVAGGLALLVISFAKTPAQPAQSAPASTSSSRCSAATSPAPPRRVAAYAFHSSSSRPTAGSSHGWHMAMRGGGAGDIRWQALVPLGFAVAFFFFAVLKMRRRFA